MFKMHFAFSISHTTLYYFNLFILGSLRTNLYEIIEVTKKMMNPFSYNIVSY